MDRSRLINIWLNAANVSNQPKEVKSKFINMLDCLSDQELIKPLLFADKKEGMSYRQIATKYNISVGSVRNSFECAKKQQGIFEQVDTDIE